MFVKWLLAGMILAACAAAGLGLASQKLLWNDELFTQVQTIDPVGYSGILLADFPEGNLCPLFYLGQKTVCRLANYRLMVPWRGEFCIYEPRGQVLLRILPVIWMSLAAALVFLYYAWRFSLPAGWLSLAVTLSAFGFWAYMPEARPYSQWFLLCLMQGILFMEILGERGESRRWAWVSAALVNAALALTIFFSAIPILATAVVMAVWRRERYWRHWIFVTLVPLLICAVYYSLVKRTYSSLSQDPGGIFLVLKTGLGVLLSGGWQSLKDKILFNIPVYWLVYILIAAFLAPGLRLAGKWPGAVSAGTRNVFSGLLTAVGLMLGMVLFVLIWFLGWSVNGKFTSESRYFIFLTPFSVLLVIAAERLLRDAAGQDPWWRAAVHFATFSVIILTALWTYLNLITWGPFWSI